VTVPAHRSDPYAILGVTPSATQEQIRRAYRTLMRQNHPDTNPPRDSAQDAAANDRLQQIIAANAILGDPARRAEYDLATTRRPRSTPPRAYPPVRLPGGSPNDPPIQAGPVRWHRGQNQTTSEGAAP
jgi:curved DNA-binding protein CbpA